MFNSLSTPDGLPSGTTMILACRPGEGKPARSLKAPSFFDAWLIPHPAADFPDKPIP